MRFSPVRARSPPSEKGGLPSPLIAGPLIAGASFSGSRKRALAGKGATLSPESWDRPHPRHPAPEAPATPLIAGVRFCYARGARTRPPPGGWGLCLLGPLVAGRFCAVGRRAGCFTRVGVGEFLRFGEALGGEGGGAGARIRSWVVDLCGGVRPGAGYRLQSCRRRRCESLSLRLPTPYHNDEFRHCKTPSCVGGRGQRHAPRCRWDTGTWQSGRATRRRAPFETRPYG